MRAVGEAIPVPAKEIRDQIRAISSSAAFSQSRRNAQLLEYLCDKVLLGRQAEIKESTIALEVFERTSSFDDKKDAIVRVEAYRLRQRLARYYATEGANDLLMIELAPGGYIPKFVVRHAPPLVAPPPETVSTSTVSSPPVHRYNAWLRAFAGVLLLIAIALGGILGLSRLNRPASSAVRLPASEARGSNPIPVTEGVRILAGSQKPYIDRAGHHWLPDQYFTGGAAQPGPTDFPGRPSDPTLYRAMRIGEFRYDIPAPPGVYELRLHFAEPTYRSGMDVGIEGGENQRHFTVALNGSALLYDFDVVTDSGRSPVDVRAFRDVAPAKDGVVHLAFQTVSGPPFVNAIELIPGTPGRVAPIRIRASDSSFTDHSGNIWSPDAHYIGGRLASHKGAVGGTPDPDLYAAERYGNFQYSVPVPPGRYSLTLYFAETFWDPHGDVTHQGGAGARVFNVSCNGSMLLTDFDILAIAKPFAPVTRTFHNLRPDGQGKLIVSFTPVRNYAALKALEIVEEPASKGR